MDRMVRVEPAIESERERERLFLAGFGLEGTLSRGGGGVESHPKQVFTSTDHLAQSGPDSRSSW